MRFIELSLALAATFVAVNAAPITSNGVAVAGSPMDVSQLTGIRRQQINKFEKRHKPCCGGGGFDVGLEGRLDIDASADTNVAVAPPAPAAEVPAPVNRNDRVGDAVNVVVNANHN